MALPKIDIPRYGHHLYGIDKDIKYRPFTVKEQKILLQAKESKSTGEEVDAIKQIIDLCTDGKLDVAGLPFFDIEDLFIRIRSKSVSDVSEIWYKNKETDERVKIVVNLSDLRVEPKDGHEKKIMLTDTIGVMMKYPTLDMILSDNKQDDFIPKCIDYIFDENEVYNDFTTEELEEWVDDFDTGAMYKINNFFRTMPRIRYETEVKFKDGQTEVLKLEGLSDLFT
jgi:hypothetical protein